MARGKKCIPGVVCIENLTLGFLVIVVIIRLLGNIISDFALALVDPRIRFK